MTVSSLWNVLDDGGCGSPVGIENFNLRGDDDTNPQKQTILAVDLSIWICEGMTSTALSSFHSDPSLYLVYQRTQKLLKLGLGLVFVVEGQRRVRCEQQTTTQQRKGSAFVNASKRCETMLKCLGVPVVRAEAEGEALCAVLSSSGIVDGVISNDGDCLLFGAKTVYTNFTCENLENRKVMRYDSDKLVANISADTNSSNSNNRSLKLSREDLIAFAILCGSDMVGGGIPHWGQKKTVQFLDACKSTKKDCLDELLLWSDEAASKSNKSSDICIDCDDDGPCTTTSRCCSLCLHPGDKRSHEKHGCSECGTGPGCGCIAVSTSEKCIRTMKEKCLASSDIASRNIVMEYFKPNNNNIPSSLNQLKSKPYEVVVDAPRLFASSLIIKGKSRESSLDCIKQTIPSLLVRLDLWSNAPRNRYNTKQRFKPNPVRIEKSVVRQSIPSYEIIWSMFTTDEQVQFNTFESKSLIDSIFPQLIKAFQQAQRQKQQGRNELERRKRYGGLAQSMIPNHQSQQRPDFSKKPVQKRKRAQRNFDIERSSKDREKSVDENIGLGNDVNMLMNNLPAATSDDTSLSPSDDDDEIVEDGAKWERSEFAAHDDCIDLNATHDDSDVYDYSQLKSYEESNKEHQEVECYQQYHELQKAGYMNAHRKLNTDHDYLYSSNEEQLTDHTSTDNKQLHSDSHYDYDYNAYTLESDEQWLQKEHDAPSHHNREGYEYNNEAADASVDLRKRNEHERVFCNFGIQIEVTPLVSSRKEWSRF